MGMFTNPLGHAGYPPGVTGRPTTQPASVRAATVAEAIQGTREDVYIAPAKLSASMNSASTLGIVPGTNVLVGNSTGTLGFYGSAGATRATQAAITNGVTPGGTAATITDFAATDYATDAATIRNDIYQLALALSNVITALRNYGLLV